MTSTGKKLSEPRKRSSRTSGISGFAIKRRLRPFDRSLPMALLRAREAVMMHFRTLHRHAGISEQQWRTLRFLFGSEPVDVTTLAQHTYLQMPSLSRILGDLQRKGLIERTTHKSDQRRRLISISDRGKAILVSEGPVSERQYAVIQERFGANRLDQLYGLLEKLEHALTQKPDEDRHTSSHNRASRRKSK